MVKLLAPIEKVTRHLCGAEYPTLNLVYPYMELLKKGFAPKNNDTVDTYINLIYGENYEEEDDDEDDEMDDNIPTAGTRQHWQYAHRQFRQKMKSIHVKRQVRRRNKSKAQSDNTELEDLNPNKVEYLPPVSTNGLFQKVRAAIYLSMDELWAVPTDTALVATFLDPRFKHFNWSIAREENKNEAKNLTRLLYKDLKEKLTIPDIEDIEETSIPNTRNYEEEEDIDDNFFSGLESISLSDNAEENDELSYYALLDPISLDNDPLEWWSKNKVMFPTLTQLARKYLSIPATSVPSERLFSDAGNHISAKRTRLSPDLVNKLLFLKRNSEHFDIFPPQE
jgi:hypothetical protein